MAGKTKIVSTMKKGGKAAAKKKKSLKQLGKQVHRSHKGYKMGGILKGQMTYKGKKR